MKSASPTCAARSRSVTTPSCEMAFCGKVASTSRLLCPPNSRRRRTTEARQAPGTTWPALHIASKASRASRDCRLSTASRRRSMASCAACVWAALASLRGPARRVPFASESPLPTWKTAKTWRTLAATPGRLGGKASNAVARPSNVRMAACFLRICRKAAGISALRLSATNASTTAFRQPMLKQPSACQASSTRSARPAAQLASNSLAASSCDRRGGCCTPPVPAQALRLRPSRSRHAGPRITSRINPIRNSAKPAQKSPARASSVPRSSQICCI
mmetsp:Transcript_72602/g.147331  ORF Transcript_72602/g.147331 Transcript_72602/m.147331 type:complete len:275 (-) Transcript_72602:205-1029(-)